MPRNAIGKIRIIFDNIWTGLRRPKTFFIAVVLLITVSATTINGFTDGIDDRVQGDSLDGLTVDVLGTSITASLTDSGGGTFTKANK